MGQRFNNVAFGILSAGIDEDDTSITLLVGDGQRFPAANTGLEEVSPASNWFKAVFTDVTGVVEIVYVRTHAADSDIMGDIIRGQEGTIARTWGSGTHVGIRLTAADVEYALNSAATLAEQVSNLSDQIALIVAGNAVPAGIVAHWPGATAPTGWIIRDGQAVSRAENPNLFALIGTTHGEGNGTTTFNVPDDVTDNRYIRAAGGSIAVGALQADQNKEHDHTGSTNTTGSHNHSENRVTSVGTANVNGSVSGTLPINYVFSVNSGSANTGSGGSHAHTLAINNSGGSEARPKTRAWLPIIKGG